MANPDISRHLVQPHKQYVSVRLQQGRLLTDADHNEQGTLNEEQQRLAALDLLGPRATPDSGFSLALRSNGAWVSLGMGAILPIQYVTLNGQNLPAYDLWLREGNLYVAGKRCALNEAERFVAQRHFLQMKPSDVPTTTHTTNVPFAQLYVLQTWEEDVSAVEDPELLDAALGGLDTSTRLCRMRRVHAFTALPANVTNLENAFSYFVAKQRETADFDRTTGERLSRGRLQLTYVEDRDTLGRCDDCEPKPAARLLGAANATLRILLTAANRYVWALDNGAPLYRILLRGLSSLGDANPLNRRLQIEMLTPPIDETAWPLPGRVVEVLPLGAVLEGPVPSDARSPHFKLLAERIGAFLRAKTGYDPASRSFELELTEGVDTLTGFVTRFSADHPEASRLNFTAEDESDACVFYCRFWHDASRFSTVDIPVVEGQGGAPLGDTGIIPVFHRLGQRGDYWIAAVRPDHPRSIVPFELAARAGGVAPHGPKDHFVPLALVSATNDQLGFTTDARQGIGRAVDTGCVTFTVGDGLHSQGDFTRIQDAIEALPSFGGHLLVRRGTYRERLQIIDRSNVTIEACGEEVVVETPTAVASTKAGDLSALPLLYIEDSHGIRVSGLRLNAIEERAVFVYGSSSGITLDRLICRAGIRSGTAFVPGTAQPSGLPLVALDGLLSGDVSGLVLEPSSRQALFARAVRLNVTGLTVVSDAQNSLTPTEPLVAFDHCQELLVEDSALTAHGRVGLEVAYGSDVTLRQLSVIVSRHRDRQNKTTQSREGIVFTETTQSRLLSSWLTMDESASDSAALYVHGEGLTIAQNHFEVLARCFDSPSPSPPNAERCGSLRVQAWGGLQLAGGCRNVEVRENQILGGVGHGITLGSYHFVNADNTKRVRNGAGFGQIATRRDGQSGPTGQPRQRLTGRYTAPLSIEDDGALVDIRLLENRIEQMNGSGISAITVLGFPDESTSLIEVMGLVIARNTIVDNLKAPAENIALAENFGVSSDSIVTDANANRQSQAVSVLPLGGIVLGAVTAASITGNTIVGNGHSQTAPTNGIFVLLGEQLQIAHNRISGNGGRARIDSPSYSPPAGPEPGIRAGIAVLLAGTATSKTPLTRGEDADESVSGLTELFEKSGVDLDDGGTSLRILGNTVRHPEGRALHVVAAGPVSIVGNFLSSEGNHGADTLSDAYLVGDVVYVQNLGAPWEGDLSVATGPSLSNHVTPVNAGDYLALGDAEETRGAFGEGGAIQFKDNQVSFDWEVLRVPHLKRRRPPLSLFPVALVSLDHLTVDGNQFAFRLRGRKIRTSPPRTSPTLYGYVEPVFGHVLGVGGTVQISNNRIAESVGSTLLSLCAIGELAAMVTYNQSTHEVLVVSDAYNTDVQLAALSAPIQGYSQGEPSFIDVEGARHALRLLNPLSFQRYPSITVNVGAVDTALGTATLSVTLPPVAGAASTSAAVTVGKGVYTVAETGMRLYVDPTRLPASNTNYSLDPRITLVAEGTEPPVIKVKNADSYRGVNAEFELLITQAGEVGDNANTSLVRPRYRTRLHGGEAWSVTEAELSGDTNVALSDAAHTLNLACAWGKYSAGTIYRCTTYHPLSPTKASRNQTDGNPIASAALATETTIPKGAYRIVLDILAGGAIGAATTTAPPCRYSLDGGRTWSDVLTLADGLALGDTGLVLSIDNPMQSFVATDYFEFETYLPPLSRDLSFPYLTRLGNQVLFRPQGTGFNVLAQARLVQFSKRFLVLLSRVSS